MKNKDTYVNIKSQVVHGCGQAGRGFGVRMGRQVCSIPKDVQESLLVHDELIMQYHQKKKGVR